MKKIQLAVSLMLLVVTLAGAQSLQLKWSTDTLLRVPESVLFDSKTGTLYVSNIVGKSNEKDGKGFISKVGLDGKITTLEWGSGVDAPKGMGMYKGNLYVADLTRVAVFDLATGKLTSSIPIEGAEFLNDVTVDSKGNVYVSDSAKGRIYKVSNGKADLYFESADLKRVNGLLALKGGVLYVADAGNGKNYKLTEDKKLSQYSETAPGADGIVLVGKDEYIVSSWGGEVYFVDASGKATKMLDTKEQKLNSADIDYDEKTKTVFIPTFFGNKVMAYEFKK